MVAFIWFTMSSWVQAQVQVLLRWISLLWCCHWWDKTLKYAFTLMEVFQGPAISASCNCMEDLTHSRKHMGRRENCVAEAKVLPFFRPKWLLYVIIFDSFSNIITALACELCFLPIWFPWAGVIIFHGEARRKINKVFAKFIQTLPSK